MQPRCGLSWFVCLDCAYVQYLLVSVGITLASVGITVNAIWFNARDLNGLLGQLGVSAKVTVLWNTGEWDSPIVGISQCFNKGYWFIFIKKSLFWDIDFRVWWSFTDIAIIFFLKDTYYHWVNPSQLFGGHNMVVISSNNIN